MSEQPAPSTIPRDAVDAVVAAPPAVPTIPVDKVEVVVTAPPAAPARLILIEERVYTPPPREEVPLHVEAIFVFSVALNLFSFAVSWIDFKILIKKNRWNMSELTAPQYSYYFGIQEESDAFVACNILGFMGYIGCTFLVYWKYYWHPKHIYSFMMLTSCWCAFNLNYYIFRKWMLSALTPDQSSGMVLADLGTIKTAFWFYVVFSTLVAPLAALGVYRVKAWKKKIFSEMTSQILRGFGILSVVLMSWSIVIALASKSSLAGIAVTSVAIAIGLGVIGYSRYMIHENMRKQSAGGEEAEKLIKVDESTEIA